MKHRNSIQTSTSCNGKQQISKKKKEKERGQRKRIVTKKEHNCTQVKEKSFNTCAQFY